MYVCSSLWLLCICRDRTILDENDSLHLWHANGLSTNPVVFCTGLDLTLSDCTLAIITGGVGLLSSVTWLETVAVGLLTGAAWFITGVAWISPVPKSILIFLLGIKFCVLLKCGCWLVLVTSDILSSVWGWSVFLCFTLDWWFCAEFSVLLVCSWLLLVTSNISGSSGWRAVLWLLNCSELRKEAGHWSHLCIATKEQDLFLYKPFKKIKVETPSNPSKSNFRWYLKVRL